MNHIYKVIFNKATGTFMAVAEYAKSHSTGGGSCATGQVGSVCTLSFARIATLAVLVIGATLNSSAYAKGDSAIEIDQRINGANNSAKANGEASIAVGSLAKADGNQSIAIGSVKPNGSSPRGQNNVGSHAKGHESIAIGGDVLASGNASIAIGSDDLYLNDQKIQGLVNAHPALKAIRDARTPAEKYIRTTASGHASTAVGAMSQATGHFSNAFGTRAHAKGPYSLAVGLTATAEQESAIAIGSNAQAKKFRTVALGADTIVNFSQGIALGYGSQVLATDDNNTKTPYIPTGKLARQHTAVTWGPLSIGTSAQKRRIINVGAGSEDTDAVNVAQLRKVVEWAQEHKITFKGDDNGAGVQTKLNETLTIKGGADTSKLTDKNIGVVKDNGNGGGLKVQLAKALKGLEAVNTQNLTATGTITVNTSTSTAKLLNSGLTVTDNNKNKQIQVGTDGIKFADVNGGTSPSPSPAPATAGTTRIARDKIGFADASGEVDQDLPYLNKEQLRVGSVKITKGGIDAGNKKISNLTAGTKDTDAVTIQQLKTAKPTLTGGTGIEISNTNNLSVADNGTITAPYYTIKVKTTELTDTGSGGGKFSVGNSNDNSLVTAKNLADYLNQVNETADSALPSFTVKGDDDANANAITVTKNNNTLKLKGKDGLTVATSQDGTVTFGLAQNNGLTVGKSTLNDGGLTVKNNNEQIQVGANGIEFTAVNNNGAGAGIENTARITRDKIGFTGANGLLDESKPHLSLTGINAGGNAITNLPKLLTDATDSSTGHVSEIKGLPAGSDSDIDKSKAASITDVLNAGFNLQGNDKAVDFVSTYDTVNFIDGNATTAKVTYNDKTSKVTYNVNVDNKTIELTGDNGTKNKIGVKTIKLTETSTNGNATTFSTDDDHALVKASDIAGNLNTLAEEIHTTKGTADTALQTFTVKKVDENDKADDTNAITVGKDGTSGKVNTLKLKGKNGLDIKTDKDGTVTFGINTQSGLKAGDSTTLNNNGLSIKNTASNEQIQVGADGVKFAMVNNGVVGAGIDGTTRITRDEIGFTGTNGSLDKSKPHLSKDGINAGGKKITNIQSGEIAQNSHDAVTGGKIYDLKTELENKISSTAKTAQNSLHEFSVADEQGNNFTVSNPYSSYDTSKTSDVITFAGENGITTKVNKGVVRVGIDQTKGLTTPKLTVGNNNGKGIVIDSQNGQNTITGLSNTLANVTNDKGSVRTTEQGKIIKDEDKTRAASIVDVLSAGFNLQGNGEAVDFVSTYDTVNFADGNATTAKVTYDDTSKTSKVVYDVNVDDTTIEVKDKKLGVKTTTLTSTGTGANKFALSNQATGDALVKASDIVAHLNTLSGDIQTAKGASQANSSAGYVDADGNKVIYDSTDNKYYQAKNDGTVDKTKEVAKDKLVAQAQTPDGTLAQMNVKSVINKEQVNDANKKQGINEDNAFVKGLEKAASDNKTKNAAVTVGDLNAVAQTPLTFAGDTGTTAKKLGETLTIKGGQTDTNKLTDNNIGVVAGTDGFTVKLAKDLTNLNSVNAGGTKIDDKGVSFVDSSGQAKANTPVLSANGLDLGGKVISNVGKGTKDTDAANVQQLNEVRNLLGLGNAGNDNADGNQVNIADIKKDPNSGSSSNRTVIKAGTVLGGKGNNDTEKLATGGVQVGVDKDGNANGDLSNVWVKTQKDGSKKALLATYNAAGQTNYLTNNPAEAIDRINEQGIRFFHVNDGNQEPVVQGRNGIDSSASGKHSVAIGFQAKADGEAAVAIGRQTQAGNQSIAIGDNAQATGDQSIAIGTGNVVAGKHSGAIGDPSTVKADNSYSVGNNNQFTDATQTDVFGVGNNITVTESNSVALGSNSAISAGTHAGTQAKKSDGTAGTTTTAGATGTVKGFAGQTAVGAVSVGASGAERRIQNVAAGEVSATSTDAVNGSQLYKATQSIANATNELDHRIHQNENKANAGISSAMAMASMPQAYIPGRSMVTGGIATHNGQGAVAVGLSKLSDNGQWVFKINGSADTQGHVGAAVGAGFHF
ncbi:YadA-like family protein [Moraxella catarrhalis]|uniref:YadA-like family protein n=1 Tax=Moraxella catarrhalis TaxID=480 RepID=UPI001EED2FB6|nr:YadA-like family protein [Moraxella catarrhalis]MCG6819385.1 YadA-like family protein [Moraxella catarrhalis]MCG6830869.1 YadA-like family protein [Moraxella catarrhalis]